MTNRPQASLDRLRDRIEESGDLSDDDRKVLQDFDQRLSLLNTEYSTQRQEKLLRHCTIIAEEVGGLADSLTDRDAAEDILAWINRNYDNPETNKDYRIAFRVLAKRVTDGSETPESVDWVPSSTPRSYNPKPNPAEMLDWEDDTLPMIDATFNSRDAALIAVAWDSGARSGEIRNLTVGDVTEHKHGLQIVVDGKTGQRAVTLIPSVPYLRRWVQDHPRSDEGDAPLWCKLESGESMSYQMFRKALRQAAEKADVTKPVTFTNYRKSSATYLASQSVNQAHIEDHHGWTRGSDVAARYVAIFGGDSDRELARAHGREVEEEEREAIAPLTCPRCERETPRDEEFCVWCGRALSQEAVASVKEGQREVERVALKAAREDPELLDRVEERKDIVELLEDNPELVERARDFAEAQ